MPAQAELDLRFMALALAQAEAAGRAGEVPVGAVLVHAGVVIASGHNRSVGTHDPSAHAEMVALRTAALALGNYRLEECTLYVTLEPCAMCAGAVLHARLQRLVFGAADPKTGAAGSVLNLFALPELNHQTQVRGGVHADACADVLQQFFRQRRDAVRATAQPLRDDALRAPAERFDGLTDPFPAPQMVTNLTSLGGWRLSYVDSPSTIPHDSSAQEGSAVLCLHGWGEWGYLFRHLLPLLTRQRVLVPDLIGFGRSDQPKRESIHSLAWHGQVLAEWLQRLGVQRAVLVYPESMAPLVKVLRSLSELGSAQRVMEPSMLEGQASEAVRNAWRAPFPNPGHAAGRRVFCQRGVSRADLLPAAAAVLAQRIQSLD